MGNDMEQMEHLIDLPAEETATKPAPPADDFDLESYRLTQDYASLIDVKKIITTVPVKKPEKLWFIRVHPNGNLKQRFGRQRRSLNHTWCDRLFGLIWLHEMTAKSAFRRNQHHKVFFLWPVKLPGEDGRTDHWNESALEAARVSQEKLGQSSSEYDAGSLRSS